MAKIKVDRLFAEIPTPVLIRAMSKRCTVCLYDVGGVKIRANSPADARSAWVKMMLVDKPIPATPKPLSTRDLYSDDWIRVKG